MDFTLAFGNVIKKKKTCTKDGDKKKQAETIKSTATVPETTECIAARGWRIV